MFPRRTESNDAIVISERGTKRLINDFNNIVTGTSTGVCRRRGKSH